MPAYFDQLDRVRFEGTQSTNPLAFRHYNPDEIVLGKRMEDHLRFAACYWHTFCWNGADMFGMGASIVRGSSLVKHWRWRNAKRTWHLSSSTS